MIEEILNRSREMDMWNAYEQQKGSYNEAVAALLSLFPEVPADTELGYTAHGTYTYQLTDDVELEWFEFMGWTVTIGAVLRTITRYNFHSLYDELMESRRKLGPIARIKKFLAYPTY